VKKIFIVLFCLSGVVNAQVSFLQKKIAQKREVFVNNTWQGIDSVLWHYNTNGDSTQKSSLIFSSNNWTPLQNNLFSYNSAGLVDVYIRQNWNGTSWQNASQFLSTYGAGNVETVYQKNTWNGSSWLPNQKLTRTLNGINKIQSELFQMYTTGWQNNSRATYTYDANDSVSEIIDYTFDVTAFQFNPLQRRTYSYTNNGALSQYSLFGYDTALANWAFKNQTTYYYNAANQPSSIVHTKNFNLSYDFREDFTYYTNSLLRYKVILEGDTNNVWTESKRYEYAYYPDSSVKSVQVQNYFLGNWITDSQSFYTYKANKKVDSIYHQKVTNGNLDAVQLQNHVYDANQNLVYWKLQDINSGNAINNKQSFFYYNQFPLSLNTSSNSSIVYYPNPASGTFYIKGLKNGTVSVAIVNAQGNVVQSLSTIVLNTKATVNISTLTPGIYLLYINNGGAFKQGKLVVQ
jgi:hypothetical protein